jgi:hypothetical protein
VALTKSERTAIAEQAAEIAAEFADEPLPSSRELAAMSIDELDALFKARGVTIDWERIEADVRSAIGSDALLINRGVELDDAKILDLEKRSARAVAGAARSIANQTIGDMRQEAMLLADDRPDDQKYLVWVSVGNGCPSCQDRHGTVLALDAWEGNMPRDGGTLCKGNCRCSLVPVGDPGSGNEGLRVSDG